MDTVIDLGVTVLGGCVSVDTTDYSTYAGGPTQDITDGSHSPFSASIVTSGDFGAPAEGNNAVKLTLGGGNAADSYHVKHGPAIVSDEFKALAGQLITLNWFSAAGGDDFAVIGYLLDTDANGNGVAEGTVADCSQTEVLDTHGSSVSGWQYASVMVPDTRNFYKFVFVNGTHDLSGGRFSGALFWIDNISQGASQTVLMDLSDVTGKNFFVGGGTSAPFSIAGQATASSGLTNITYASTTPLVCTVSGTTVTITGHGTCTLSAAQPGGTDGSGTLWAASSAVTSSFVVTNTAPTPQTITFGALSDKSQSAAPFSVSATTSSGGTVTYTSSTTAVCTVTSAGVVTLKTSGTCTITANAAQQTIGGTLYAAATPVSQSFTVNAAQTITFNPTDKLYTSPNYNLTATTSSGLPLTYTSSTPSICTVTSSGTVDLLDVGTCTITASQAGGTSGGTTYGAASVTKSFEATPAGQTVNFPTLPEWRLYEGDEITPAATASSGLPVTYTTTTPLVCTIVGGKINVVGLGKCTVKAIAAAGAIGGTKYGESAEVTREFFITDTKPTATFTPTNTRTPTPTLTPTPIPFLLKKGAIGASFVLGLLQNDTLVTWGMNREFQANIPPCCGSGIQDIAVGTNFALALKGGRVYGWGANTKGQLKFPKNVQSGIKAVAAGGAHGLALTNAGKVIAWGDNGFKQAAVPPLAKVVKSVVGGSNHTVVLFTDGTVKAWGSNANKQSSPPTTLKGITQIAAGLDHNLALKGDGTITAWGGNTHGQATIPSNAIDIKQVSAGTQFSMAVKNNGEVLAWGRNDYNQTFIPSEYTDIYSAFAGYANTILGLRNGRVIVLGDQSNGINASRTPTKTATPTP
ncbi:MAG: hypothetical protein DWI54_08040 [Chloroflexi bacterium]|nr:MAG: hypothetical protein DWI54_08040 [Chloroflexota bacterium]